MKHIIISFIATIILTSCSQNTVFKEYSKMDRISWNKLDIQTFDVPVEKGKKYDFYFSLRHHTDFPYTFMDVNITFFTPDGEMRSRDYHYGLKNTKHEWKGDGMGDLWDVDLPIRKNMEFNESGICKVRLENRMRKIETPGIIEVGLVVKLSSD